MTQQFKLSTIKIVIYGVLILLALASCKSKQIVLTNTVTETVTEILHDTVFVVEPDSSMYHAWIECKNGKPILKNPESKSGKNLNAPDVKLGDDGKLHVNCETRALELFAQWKSTHKQSVITKEIPIEIIKPLTQWQVCFIKMGQIFGVLLMVALGYSLFRIYKNVKK